MPDDKPLDEDDTELRGDEPGEVTSKPVGTGVAVLAFVALALLSALVAMAVRNGTFRPRSSPGQLESQIRANELRNQINARLNQLHLPPLADESAGESIEDMAKRMKKDADLIVDTAEGYQKLIVEKSNALEAKNQSFLKSEELRESLAADIRALRQDFDIVKKDLLATTEKLIAAERKIKELEANPEASDYADLQRRYEEALRAKEFFEARVKDLEAAKPK